MHSRGINNGIIAKLEMYPKKPGFITEFFFSFAYTNFIIAVFFDCPFA